MPKQHPPQHLVATRNQAGFTLIEMMVALVLMAIGLLGFAAMSVVMIKVSSQATQADEGATLVQSIIEELSGVNWSLLGTDTTVPSANGLSNGDVYTEGPVNRRGEPIGTGSGPYAYYRHTVVCSSSTTISAGGAPDHCAQTMTAGARPTELSCDGSTLIVREKMIRVLVSWRDRNGNCKFKAVDSLVFQ